jgi:hypothetical protein
MAEQLTAKEQIASVHRFYPQMDALMTGPSLVIWEGRLAGFSRSYCVKIFWHRWLEGDGSIVLKSTAPRIYVTDPPLLDRANARVPHLYASDGPHARICCYDPAASDWDVTKPMGKTLLPFIEQWLSSYELWRVTGDWPAPGRHPEVILCEETTLASSTSCPDRPAPSTAAAIARIGRLIETSASSALMAVASEASYRWPCWRDWNATTWPEAPSPLASISLPAPPPAPSSLLDSPEV